MKAAAAPAAPKAAAAPAAPKAMKQAMGAASSRMSQDSWKQSLNEETWNKMKHEIERDYNEYIREFRKGQETRRHVETVKEMRNRQGLTWTRNAAHKSDGLIGD